LFVIYGKSLPSLSLEDVFLVCGANISIPTVPICNNSSCGNITENTTVSGSTTGGTVSTTKGSGSTTEASEAPDSEAPEGSEGFGSTSSGGSTTGSFTSGTSSTTSGTSFGAPCSNCAQEYSCCNGACYDPVSTSQIN
jgi:hypothetical protein